MCFSASWPIFAATYSFFDLVSSGLTTWSTQPAVLAAGIQLSGFVISGSAGRFRGRSISRFRATTASSLRDRVLSTSRVFARASCICLSVRVCWFRRCWSRFAICSTQASASLRRRSPALRSLRSLRSELMGTAAVSTTADGMPRPSMLYSTVARSE